ncbi:MAG: undecaprenyl/decaprenyl-phosphate alpha-N-acetylglucosaminyl 1-phosphate transferase, partial [Planctomycetales bacterium]
GLLDDRRGLDWRFRLLVQTLVATCVAAGGCRLTFFVDLPLLTGTITVFWIVGLINAFNMLDNMDGLSAGVAAIAGGMFATVMLTASEGSNGPPQLFVACFLLVLVGSLVGYLHHNRPPAKLFMGDAGSYFIGYWLAVGTILATFRVPGKPDHAILAPLCVLAVPLYDAATVIWIRLREGRSPFHADHKHFSHRLVELGMTPPQAVGTVYLLTVITGLAALLLYQVSTPWAAGTVLLLVFSVLVLVGLHETAARKRDPE